MLTASQYYACLLLAISFETAGDIFLKWWAETNQWWRFALGLFLYVTGTGFWALTLKTDSLSKALVIFACLTIVAGWLSGVFFFGEKQTGASWLALIYALAALYLSHE